MRTNILLIAILCSASVASAQRGDSRLPRPGSPLPDVTAFDEQGREFSLTELRGEYAVLVFGCLT